MNKQSKIWYSFKGGQSDDDDIGFYNNNDFPWVKLLEDNYKIIQQEVKQYINKNEENIQPYFNNSLVTKQKSWRTFAFCFWNLKVKNNLKECPETSKILDQIPNLVSASISILEPEVQIKRHRGDTNAVVRSHLSLFSPVGLPACGFEVNDKQISWQEGKCFVFNDAAIHTAWNHSKQRRYVLLIDVMKSVYTHKKYTVCSMVLGGLLKQAVFQSMPFLRYLPNAFTQLMLFLHAACINLILRVEAQSN